MRKATGILGNPEKLTKMWCRYKGMCISTRKKHRPSATSTDGSSQKQATLAQRTSF